MALEEAASGELASGEPASGESVSGEPDTPNPSPLSMWFGGGEEYHLDSF